MTPFAFYLLGVLVGAITVWFTCNPMKAWNEGYDDAKKHYSNYHKGFEKGWEEARKVHTDYSRGFYDGWESAMKQKESDGDDT